MAAFRDDIAAWAPPEAAAALVLPGLLATTAERLMRSPRLAGRVSALLAARLGGGDPDTLAAEDRALVLASAETLRRVALRAGAVWHAARVRALVRAHDVDAFVEALGEAAREAALSCPHLAPRGMEPEPADTLEAAIRRDGAACVAAWIDALPPWAGARVRLAWAARGEGPPDPARRACAVAIVRAVQP